MQDIASAVYKHIVPHMIDGSITTLIVLFIAPSLYYKCIITKSSLITWHTVLHNVTNFCISDDDFYTSNEVFIPYAQKSVCMVYSS